MQLFRSFNASKAGEQDRPSRAPATQSSSLYSLRLTQLPIHFHFLAMLPTAGNISFSLFYFLQMKHIPMTVIPPLTHLDTLPLDTSSACSFLR